jgi:hypothetical protein
MVTRLNALPDPGRHHVISLLNDRKSLHNLHQIFFDLSRGYNSYYIKNMSKMLN